LGEDMEINHQSGIKLIFDDGLVWQSRAYTLAHPEPSESSVTLGSQDTLTTAPQETAETDPSYAPSEPSSSDGTATDGDGTAEHPFNVASSETECSGEETSSQSSESSDDKPSSLPVRRSRRVRRR
jgi:hypothetical protein